MTHITSQHNPRLKELRKLHRARERAATGLFLAEGEDLILTAQAAERPLQEGFRAPDAQVWDESFHEVDGELLAAVSTLGSGTRAIGVYEQRYAPAPSGPLCVYLHGVRDPGNVGTILRSAHAFGASCVALGPGCADPHSPKAVRASMGAIFTVALARVEDPAALPGQRLALVAHGGEALWETPWDPQQSVSLLVGSERDGLPRELLDGCNRLLNIPIGAESLNAAMAATVALYEMTRHSSRVWGP